ncbi:MAG: agmatine deiminase family protein [Lentimicrobiaceae bacterium]|nr:agmatine deiminase family protein [Lentimicrobiaceae bacterium]
MLKLTHKYFLLILICINGLFINAQQVDPELIKKGHWLNAEEYLNRNNYQRSFVETDPPGGIVRNIAEFEKMEGALIAYDASFGISYNVIKELAEDATLYTIVSGQSQQNQVLSQYTANGVNINHCKFIYSNVDSWWTRDYGPWFVTFGADSIGIIDFPYNRPRPNDDEIPKKVADSLNLPWFGMNIIHTGGNYMTTGGGIAASTDLILEENTGQTQAQINQKALDYLGVYDYALLPDPLADYIKHIDCWGKYLAPNKVLIGQVPESDPRYEDYEYIANWFASHQSPYGTPFQVYRVYSPGNSLTTPYTNSLILNNKVFVPIGENQWDDEAIAAYQQAMPGYEILGFTGSWYNTDALHCRVIGLADRGLLYINHIPLSGTQVYQEQFQISVSIKAYSHAQLFADSLRVYYKIGDGNWQFVLMTEGLNNSYITNIPVDCSGGVVQYYIHATDQSGRSANLPFIGRPDPFVFTVLPGGNPQANIQPAQIEITGTTGEITQSSLSISNTGECDLAYLITKPETDTWLEISDPSGTVSSGAQTIVSLNFNATSLSPGVYESSLTVNTNDTINPEIQAPVHFTVTLLPDIQVTPDTVVYETDFGPKIISIKNYNSTNVTIQYINIEQYHHWYFDPWTITLPYVLTAGDSLQLNLFLKPGSDDNYSYVYDSIIINTPDYEHKVILKINDQLLSGVEKFSNFVPEFQTFPNPFSNSVNIRFDLPESSSVQLSIFNFSGQKVVTVCDKLFSAGIHNLIWNALNENNQPLNQGVYFLKFTTKFGTSSQKIIYIR